MIAFRAKQVTQLATANTTLAVAVPAGIQVGDVMLAWVYLLTGSTTTITPPAGWGTVRVDATTNGRVGLYWRLVDGTETGTYTFTWSASVRGLVSVIAYSGASPTAPIGHLHVVKPTSGAALALPAKTVAVDNSWLTTMAGAWATVDAAQTFSTDEATDAERSDDTTIGGTSGNRPVLAVYDTNATVARGSTHDRVVTLSTTSINNQSHIAWWADLISDETTGVGPIAFRGAGSGGYTGSDTSAQTVNVDASYVESGDLLLAAVTRLGALTFTPPAGFTRLQFTPTGSYEFQLWYKIADGTEPATLPWVIAAGSGTRTLTVALTAYSGVNTSSPIGAWAYNQDTNPTPTITTRTAGSWVASGILRNTVGATFSTTDPLDVERVEFAGGTSTGLPIAMYDSAREYAAGSAVSRTLDSSVGGAGLLRFIVEIRPGVVDTGPSVTVNRREGAAWVEYPDATPKAWTGAEWVEAPGRYWDGAAWVDLP